MKTRNNDLIQAPTSRRHPDTQTWFQACVGQEAGLGALQKAGHTEEALFQREEGSKGSPTGPEKWQPGLALPKVGREESIEKSHLKPAHQIGVKNKETSMVNSKDKLTKFTI